MQQPSSFQVYNASAGSGKTFTLVKEYLKVVLQSDDRFVFQKILAITFTNKAASEMKARVLDNLQFFSEGKENDLFFKIVEETALEKNTIQKRSSIVLEAILQNYSAFAITTIDSFTHKIIKSFAFDLGLNLNFEVELDSDILLSLAVDVLISKIGVENDITNTLIDYSLDKAKEDKSWDISRDLNEFSKILLKDEDAKHFKKLSSKTISDFTSLKKKLTGHQKELEKRFVEIGKNCLQLISEADLDAKDFTRSTVPKFFNDVAIKSFYFDFEKRSKTIQKAIDNNQYYNKSASDNVVAAIESIVPEIITFFQQLKEVHQQFTLNSLALKSIIPLAVLAKINAELTSIKEENNIRLISEFNQLISNNIKEEPAPFIYERIGQKFMYYFIDEMQDTSTLQWQNLIPLIENALAQEKSNLMLVGDGKQAIYRWRGGKAEQFIKLGSDVQNERNSNPFQVHKEVKGLDTNYRSYSEIIAFNNSFFQYVSGHFKNPMYQQLFVDGNKQKITQKQGGFVSIDFLEKLEDKEKNDLKYAKKVHEIIINLDAGFSRKDVCVLVRRKKEGVAVANYLSEKGIEIISSETLLIQNSKKVNFIVDLLQGIQQPKDQETWLNSVYFLYDHLNIKTDKHHFIASFDIKNGADFFKTITEYNIQFDLENFTKLPFYEKIEEIIRTFYLAEESDAYIQFFLDVVFEQQKKGTEIQQFLDFWNLKKDKLSIVAPEAENAVQIMTIHKSKGLEFPVVIFPYNIEIYRQINPKTWLTELPSEQFESFDELLVNSTSSIQYIGENGVEIYEHQRQELELDNFNLLYVAFTRSVEQLYIVTEKNISKTNGVNTNFTSGIVINFLKENGYWSDDKLNYTFGNKKKVSNSEKTISTSIIQKEFISNSWRQHHIYMVANSSKLWETAQGEAIKYGNLVHEMLSKVLVKEDVEKVIQHYLQQGFLNSENSEKLKKLLLEVVHHPKLENYYSEEVVVFNEREIVSKENHIFIPDRLVFNSENEVIIIDYKTGKPAKEYHQQLISYEDVLLSMDLKVTKKILIYINEEITIEEF
ncbi:RecBCD enzyme subunit RecB [Polaribacter huanghezhanensis]|uniref:UvrD-helicase domain-containing protein n=1 Tax=Polaribacter huanghezhanensis TaxID=1354726 RepID=UPI0026483F7B|nr:UvrD-helicase domain-containing protein [Polaribacter huanghezhanensis]WKD85583.1 RecBCD enzyme subunit RecB [Polaribacter huanghezhanensis]